MHKLTQTQTPKGLALGRFFRGFFIRCRAHLAPRISPKGREV